MKELIKRTLRGMPLSIALLVSATIISLVVPLETILIVLLIEIVLVLAYYFGDEENRMRFR